MKDVSDNVLVSIVDFKQVNVGWVVFYGFFPEKGKSNIKSSEDIVNES